MILLSEVTKHYDKKLVLSNVSLTIKKGEMTFMNGPSGAGKSTLMKLIYCSERPDSGQIVVADWEVSKLKQKTIPQLRRNIGIIFQDFRLFTNKTIFENVALPLRFNGMHKQRVRDYVNEILEKVGLKRSSDVFPQFLSGGEQQRAVVARAIVSQPAVLLADEPTGNLDIDNARTIMQLFREINKKGTTVLIATHNKELYRGTGSRVLTLNNCVIEEDHIE
jgi:cell division transport system ATP-binding protein